MSLTKSIASLLAYVLGYILSCFYGLLFIFILLRRWIKDPSDRFWQVKVRELPPDCLNDPTLGNHGYIQIKNVKLHYVENGDRTKPLMLCVHGFPEFWYSWRHQLKEFSSDFWVVALDMRGYGDSEKPVGKQYYKLDYLVEDIKNVITALGKERCSLVAHDWGGVVAWGFIHQEPQMVDSYIIMNSVHPVAFMKVYRSNWSQFKKSWYVFMNYLPYLPEVMYRLDDMKVFLTAMNSTKSHPSLSEADFEAFKFTFGKPGAFTPPVNYYRANIAFSGCKALENVGKEVSNPPGLIIFGERDKYVSLDIQKETMKVVKNLKLKCIPMANHFVQQDAPEAVNEVMRKFYRSLKLK